MQVVASHVGVNVEQFGYLGSRHCLGRLTNRDVDAATGGVAECGGEILDLSIERFVLHRSYPSCHGLHEFLHNYSFYLLPT